MCRLNQLIPNGQCTHPECYGTQCLSSPYQFSSFLKANEAGDRSGFLEKPRSKDLSHNQIGFSSDEESKGPAGASEVITQDPFELKRSNPSEDAMAQVIRNFVMETEKQMNMIMMANTETIEELGASYNKLNSAISSLIGETRSISSSLSSILQVEAPPAPACPLTQSNEQNLLNQLYGNYASFTHQLVSNNILDQPLYRERNFKLDVRLTDMEGNLTINSNKIKLEMCLYTNENPPKKLELNTSGKPLFKGKIIQDLTNAKSSFEKVHIREVSSHFRGNWVFLVIQPVLVQSASSFEQGQCPSKNGERAFVNPARIRPLVLDKVVIKAKKLKKAFSSAGSTSESN